jgi:hypothetical protein
MSLERVRSPKKACRMSRLHNQQGLLKKLKFAYGGFREVFVKAVFLCFAGAAWDD